jgi:hypothetical protein
MLIPRRYTVVDRLLVRRRRRLPDGLGHTFHRRVQVLRRSTSIAADAGQTAKVNLV